MSSAVTHGILVTVVSEYIPERSSLSSRQFAFAYTVRIQNRGDAPAQLRARHWIICDANGGIQEVRGDGVVGEQPLLHPGQQFEYTSSCVIATATGTMRGTYRMVRPDGDTFDAEIAPFRLGLPPTLN